ncbi:hypothetical protein [Pseudoclavibacter helvolus]|uniref:hypothetical protein n=1 Tax=Pseudoclavibacter helvolus TaxID=255205 RepID=UPI0024ADD3D1|nr:hypothetical protein [Pseudoclavibacter helvolus]
MSQLTIFASPTGTLDGVREALADWSAEGLVGDFAWVNTDLMRDSQINALRISRGETTGASLQSLGGRNRVDLVRFCVLVPALDGQTPLTLATEQSIVGQIEESFGAKVLRVRAVVARAADKTPVRDLAVSGWHNVLISPEDSAGPNMGTRRLGPSRLPREVGAPAAAALAGLLGLWSGVDVSVLDELPVLPGKQLRISRSYSRHVSSGDLSRDLARELLSTEHGLPLPAGAGISSVYIEDVSLANEQMSDHLWSRYASVLIGPRERMPADVVAQIGFLEALRNFFTFLWGALRGAPKAWLRRLAHETKSQAAAAIQGLVYGQGQSAYSVVVKGVTSEGVPANWVETARAVTALDKLFDESSGAREHASKADLTELWRDYAAAALTLADGGERNAALPAVQVGAQRGIVRDPSAIVPGKDASFDGVPPHLKSRADDAPLLAYDDMGTQALGRHLEHLSGEPSTGLAAGVAMGQLAEWQAGHRESFANRVGARISRAQMATITEIRGLLEKLRLASDADDLVAQQEAKQRRLARTMNIIGVVYLLIAAIGVVLLILSGSFTWLLFAVVVVGAAVLWAITAIVVFTLKQRELYALIHARRQLLAEDEVNRRNLRVAVRDARRLGEAYQQFLRWSQVLSVVLHEPFGRELRFEHGSEASVQGLPMASRVGAYTADVQEVARASAQLRQDVFTYGWLSENWQAALESAALQIGPRAVELERTPELIYRQQGDTPESLLVQWADALDEYGLAIDLGRAQWDEARRTLLGSRRAVLERLTARVSEPQSDDGRSIAREEFMAGIDQEHSAGLGRLDDELLSDAAKVAGRSRVVVPWLRSARNGVSETLVLTQLSDGIEDFHFACFVDLTNTEEAWQGWAEHPGATREDHSGDSVLDAFGGGPF